MVDPKTLSAGTLNLRFMQNARRPQREPEQAHVKDDAEWQVAPEIRNAWDNAAYRLEKPVTYETSYLPFLFPSLHDTPAAHAPSPLSPSDALSPRGRRAFNKHGEEITLQASSSTIIQDNVDRQSAEQTRMSRPHSISSTGLSPLTTRQPKKSSKDPSKDAKNAIFDTSTVGTDLRQSSSIHGTSFLRPAGVDAAKTSNPAKPEPQSATGPSNQKIKRSRTSGDADKSKKKTKLELIE